MFENVELLKMLNVLMGGSARDMMRWAITNVEGIGRPGMMASSRIHGEGQNSTRGSFWSLRKGEDFLSNSLSLDMRSFFGQEM